MFKPPFCTLVAAGCVGAAISTLQAQTVVDFGDVGLGSPPTTTYAGGGVYYNGSDLAGGFTSRGVNFVTDYDSTWGSWSGWSYSTTTDVSTAGYGNQHSAFAGSGHGDSTYVIGYVGFTGLSLDLPAPSTLQSVFLTNSTYAGLSMTDGDAFSKQFGGIDGSDPDYFLLTITGQDVASQVTGSVEFYLADFRSADPLADYIAEGWTEVDLSGLGSGVKTLLFSLTSSDNGAYGMNTPAYFALDDLSFTAVPEASILPSLGALLALVGLVRRRR